VLQVAESSEHGSWITTEDSDDEGSDDDEDSTYASAQHDLAGALRGSAAAAAKKGAQRGATDGALRGSAGGPLRYGPEPPLAPDDTFDGLAAEARAECEAAAAAKNFKEAHKKSGKGARSGEGLTDAPSQLAGNMMERDVRFAKRGPYARSKGLRGDSGGAGNMDRVREAMAAQGGSETAAPDKVFDMKGFDGPDLVEQARAMAARDVAEAQAAAKAAEAADMSDMATGDVATRGVPAAAEALDVSLAQLQATAEKHGVPLQQLIQDARDKGVKIH
jgi:hypothetical protein